MCRRGDIYYVDFGDDLSSRRQCGFRPAIVVSNDTANRYAPIVTVVPLTSKVKKKHFQPTHVLIGKQAASGLSRESMALAEQVVTIDKEKLVEYTGRILDPETMEQLTRALQIQIGAI